MVVASASVDAGAVCGLSGSSGPSSQPVGIAGAGAGFGGTFAFTEGFGHGQAFGATPLVRGKSCFGGAVAVLGGTPTPTCGGALGPLGPLGPLGTVRWARVLTTVDTPAI